METLGNKSQAKTGYKFYCNVCDYGTSKKSGYDAHMFTAKHKKNENGNVLETFGGQIMPKICPNKYQCLQCSKIFKNRSGLWKHAKKCTDEVQQEQEQKQNNDKLVEYLMKENSEFKHLILEALKNGSVNNSNNIINNNSNNKSFNLQFFLNETCKDAMNITDFVNSIQLQLSDLEKVGELGYIEGISNIIVKNLNALDVTLRPVHCTDKKRETMYIKDEDKWEKEDENKDKMHKVIRKVANKNISLISKFQEIHPDWKKCSSKYADQFNKIVIEAMGGKGDDDHEKEEKIIKRVAKEVLIDKINL